jgi:tetratricopeptide (TPR) repeat protein
MHRQCLIVICLLVLFAVAEVQPLSPVCALDGEAFLGDTKAALDAQDYPRALSLAEKAVAVMPSSSEAYRMRGSARRFLKDLQNALSDYDRAVQLDPRNHVAFGGRAGVRLQLNDLNAALLDANRAVALKADYAAGLAIRADILIAQKRYALAITDLNEVLRLKPKNANALITLGDAKYGLGDYRGAIEDYNAAEKLDSRLAWLYYDRGLARQALKESAAAEQDFTRSIEMRYRMAEAYAQRGGAALDRGDSARARQDLTKALELDPNVEYAQQRISQLSGVRQASSVKGDHSGVIPGLRVRFPDLPRPSGELWSKPSSAQVALPEDAPALQLPVPNPAQATNALPLGEISTTIAGLRTLAGPLSPEQEKIWARKWQPFFDYPDPEALKYFRALNPMLQELHGVRGVVNRAAQDFDGAWAEAVVSHAVGDSDGAKAALAEAGRHASVLKSANSRLAQIQKQAQALGNPPDPKEAKAKARAWSKKWLVGSDTLARTAYLWRVNQLANVNVDARLGAILQRTAHQDIWPAGLETWTRWFNGGEKGSEPRGAEPGQALMQEAGALVKQWYDPTGFSREIAIRFFQESSPREAAQSIQAGRKVVPHGPLAQSSSRSGTSAATLATKTQQPEEKVRQAAEEKANEDAITEKEALIRLIRYNLSRDEAEWQREKDTKRKEKLYLQMLKNRSAIQHEQDLIQSLRTGEYVHTRTPSDDYCHDLMIVRGMQAMERVGEARRLSAAVEKMTSKAEPDQVKQLQDFVTRQITPKDLAQGNVEKTRQVAQAVFNTVQGRREQAVAKHLEDAIIYEDYELRAEKVKSRAGLTLLLTGMAAPAYAAGAGTVMSVGGTSAEALTGVAVVYGATTGTIEGGPLEGLKQGVAMTGLSGMVASEMMTGYQKGGLVSSGGAIGAVERGTEAFMGGKLVESIAGKAGAWYAEKAKTGLVPPAPLAKPELTVAQMVESQSFQTARRRAQQEVEAYRSLTMEIASAKVTGASAARLAELEGQRIRKALELNENFLGKRMIKAAGKTARAGKGAAADAELETDFAQAVTNVYSTKVDPLFRSGVKQAKLHWRKKAPGGQWQHAGELEFKEFRQGAAGKTANTDRDLGLIEKKNQEGEIYQLFKGDKPVSLADTEKELQRIYENAYEHAGGSDARLAMQHITTSGGLESYKDLVVTQLNNPDNVARINKGWAAQSAEVLQNKVTHAGTGKGEFAALFKKIDGANQAAKDIDQRLLPLLKSIQSKSSGQKAFQVGQDMDRWRAIQHALANVENDPVGASRQLRVLTGLDSIGEVSELSGKAFVGAAKLQ